MPDLDYATTLDGKQVAFRSYSSGPGEPLIYLPGLLYSIESICEDPPYARLINGLAELRPLVLVERRGVGASDPVAWSDDVWEQWAADVIAVLDRLGVERASIASYAVGANIALQTAARFPNRVAQVVALHPLLLARDLGDDASQARLSRMVDRDPDSGYREMVAACPSRVHDPGFVDWFIHVGRLAASPSAATQFWAAVSAPNDLRDRLDTIEASVLLLCRRDYVDLPDGVEGFREGAARVPNSKALILDGADLPMNAGDIDGLLFEVAEFLSDGQQAAKPLRPLAALLFTDLVASTETVRSMGDEDWRTVLDRHDRLIDETVRHCGGTVVKATGDGALATFDSPSRALRGATALRDQLAGIGRGVRIGLHVGEIEGRGADIAGVAVHLAARIMSIASPGQILTSAAVPLATMGGDTTFRSCGHHRLKGFDEEFEVFEVTGTNASTLPGGSAPSA